MSMYDDIINLPHWEPKTRQRMSAEDRAGQFAPFAALTGYDAMVSEKARLIDEKPELAEEQLLALNNTLSAILKRISDHPTVAVTWFRQDPVKEGGEYVTTEGVVRDVELTTRIIVMRSGQKIALDDVS